MTPTLQKEKKINKSQLLTEKSSMKKSVDGQDILSQKLVRQLQSRVSIFNVDKDKENFNNILSSFL